MAEPLREPGWYRLTEAGWEPVDDAMARWQMACNRAGWACGCVTWHELLPGGSWITRRRPCSRHDHG